MAAPLHSKFKRHFDRDVKDMVANLPSAKPALQKFKHRALVYSLSSAASHEAGAWCSQPPSELLNMVKDFRLPASHVWVEFDWPSMNDGMATQGIPAYARETDHPVRLAILLGTEQQDPTIWSALNYYVYPNGKTWLGPTVTTIGSVPIPEIQKTRRDTLAKIAPEVAARSDKAALGYAWSALIGEKEPRLLAKLESMTNITVGNARSMEAYLTMMNETNGNARVVLACMAAIAYAQRKRYVYTGEAGQPRDPRPSELERHAQPYEVDLYLKPNVVPGKTFSRGVREYAKRGAHPVIGHYAYRRADPTTDPRKCPVSVSGHHDFEPVAEGSKTEQCTFCLQKRWYKDQHVRGEGPVKSQPIYNVRA